MEADDKRSSNSKDKADVMEKGYFEAYLWKLLEWNIFLLVALGYNEFTLEYGSEWIWNETNY